jgi:hypothetical protein
VLDQELTRLADKYRAAIVLCDLEGRTRKQAARQLKIPEGTLSSRLTTARRLLAKRLARRGLALPGGGLAALVMPQATAACPPALLACTVKAATLLAAGQPVASGLITVSVHALKEGVLQTMFLNKLKNITAAFVLLGTLVFGAGLVMERRAQAQPQSKGASAPMNNGSQGKPAKQEAASAPAAYNAVFNQALAILGEYFTVEYANRHDGRIETLPALAPVDKGTEVDQPGKAPTIRQRATVSIAPSNNDKFRVDVRVLKEAKWLAKGQTGKAYWDPAGRDERLESVILRRLAEVPAVDLDLYHIISVIVVQADAKEPDQGELRGGQVLGRPQMLIRQGSTRTVTAAGGSPVPIAFKGAFKVTSVPEKRIRLEAALLAAMDGKKNEALIQATMRLGERLKLTMHDDAGQPMLYIHMTVSDEGVMGTN